jgi:hypothetical protein
MDKKYNDIYTGDRFGEWIILDENDFEQKKGYRKFKCQCQCINKTIKYVDERNLKNGSTVCCGNCTFKNIEIGDVFGEWTVINNTKINKKVLCVCSCCTENMVNVFNLHRGISTSCGCIQANNHFVKNQYTDLGNEIIIGNTYNKWTVLEQVKSSSYLCECSCTHRTRQILRRSELLGDFRLGCKKCRRFRYKKCKLRKDIIGQTFGYLTIVSYDEEKTKEKGRVFINVKCKCGNEFSVEKNSVIRGKTSSCGCKKHEYVDLTGYKYGHLTVLKFVGRYDERNEDGKGNNYIKWLCKCDCGKETEVRQGNLLSGSTKSCGCVKSSRGEDIIREFLNKYKYNFIEQYWFKDCRNKLPLRFDFVVTSNNIPVVAIEFDGQQHYEPFAFNGNNNKYESFKLTQINDNIKTKYCYDSKIPLLRIPYWELEDDNIGYLLWDFLVDNGLIIEENIA